MKNKTQEGSENDGAHTAIALHPRTPHCVSSDHIQLHAAGIGGNNSAARDVQNTFCFSAPRTRSKIPFTLTAVVQSCHLQSSKEELVTLGSHSLHCREWWGRAAASQHHGPSPHYHCSEVLKPPWLLSGAPLGFVHCTLSHHYPTSQGRGRSFVMLMIQRPLWILQLKYISSNSFWYSGKEMMDSLKGRATRY